MILRRPLSLVVVLALAAGAAYAQQDAPPPPAFDPPSSPPVEMRRSELPESVLRAERETGGQVLRVESMQRDGREVYRLKVLTPDGRVRIMRDDPHERRREAWREARADALRDPFAEPDLGSGSPAIDADRSRDRREERFERFEAPPPADLDVPETLPPVERGDRD
ncbi:hypothetical protein [Silanimonas sp.]|uniref:PepSY domain-containing protein n=1 Tax=Silanimonas sp. TaxID=1929290 RepID=UPI0022BF0333|nr:hypothetical protein [Silanimonas sp.]MCZ8061959.1 hypothetical protein [Silanimonas sp.]